MRKHWRLFLRWVGIVALSLGASEPVLSDFTDEQPMQHFFNARLLQPGEYQVSIYGNFRIGLTETLELGTNAFGYFLFDKMVPNLALKHQMFRGENYETSFSSHSVLLPSSLFASSDDSSESESSTGQTFLSLHGIVTGFELSGQNTINVGLYDLYILQQQAGDEASLHVLSPTVGVDLIFSRRFGASLILMQPVYAIAQQNTDFGDAESELDFSQDDPSSVRLLMITGTISWETFNVEAGVSNAFGLTSLYLNLFWRIRD